MKRGWVILAVLLLPVIFLIYFFLRPTPPLVVFRLMDPPAYAVGSNEMQWQIEVKNNGYLKELCVDYTFEKRGTETIMPTLNHYYYSGTWIPPQQHIITGPVTSTDSKDEYRLILVFSKQSKIQEKIRAKFGNVPIVRNFLQASKTNLTTASEWFRIPSPPTTNGWPAYKGGGNH